MQLVCDLNGRQRGESDPVDGRRHDSAALDISGVLEGLDERTWLGDKGYIGKGMITPIRKPVDRELLDWEKEHNTAVNRIRWMIERRAIAPTSRPGEFSIPTIDGLTRLSRAPCPQCSDWSSSGTMLNNPLLLAGSGGHVRAISIAIIGSAEMAGHLSHWDRYYLKSYESMAGHRFNLTTFAVEPNVWGTVSSGRMNSPSASHAAGQSRDLASFKDRKPACC